MLHFSKSNPGSCELWGSNIFPGEGSKLWTVVQNTYCTYSKCFAILTHLYFSMFAPKRTRGYFPHIRAYIIHIYIYIYTYIHTYVCVQLHSVNMCASTFMYIYFAISPNCQELPGQCKFCLRLRPLCIPPAWENLERAGFDIDFKLWRDGWA